jgi:hypothetical protein
MSVAILAWLAAAPAAQAPPKGKSAATITGAFADSCRDFTARSSKDISFVEIHYVFGLWVKNESISSHDYAIDGVAGDEIEFATVKSGTTIEEFACVPSNRAPTALVEIQTPPIDQYCQDFFSGEGLLCDQSSPRTVWTSASEIPPNRYNQTLLIWGCASETSPCLFTFSFRGTGSSDPDGDIASWSLDFGDGTSASGSWITASPTVVAHEYTPDALNNFCHDVNSLCVITLTVTDSAGQSDSDAFLMQFLDQRPG